MGKEYKRKEDTEKEDTDRVLFAAVVTH